MDPVAWRQDPVTSAWSQLEPFTSSTLAPATLVASAVMESAELAYTPRNGSTQPASRSSDGSDGARPIDPVISNGRVDGTAAEPINRTSRNEDPKVGEHGNGSAQVAEVAKNAVLDAGVKVTSAPVAATPAPKARAGKRPSPGWRVGKDPWLSPAPDEDVPASPLARSPTTISNGKVRPEQERIVESAPLRHDDKTAAAEQEASTTKRASEVDEGDTAKIPDQQGPAVPLRVE